jgi:hydrogenase maturation protein HypF
VLACGAEEKNTFCLTRDEYAFLSQHIGDMDNEETVEHFENTIDLYQQLFRVKPEILAYDLHPEYLSTKYALTYAAEKGLPAIGVQHHHAHIVGCLVENGFDGQVIGIAFDGVGYGTDGNLWGGEFLVCDRGNFERVAHLEYAPMPGGATAIHKPYRMALGYIYALLGPEMPLDSLPIMSKIPYEEVNIIRTQLVRRLNSPLTSGAGRLFDAVSALAGVRGQVDYEAQAAIELEMIAPDDVTQFEPYPFIIDDNKPAVIKLHDLISAVVNDVQKGIEPGVVSARFHLTMTQVILETCRLISQKSGLKTVALSGGVFQNRLLLNLVVNALEKEGFNVLTHHLVPCNDGGISLGQAVVANYQINNVKE